MHGPFFNNHQNPRYQWVPKSTLADRSLPSSSSAPPPPNPKPKRRNRRNRRNRSSRRGKHSNGSRRGDTRDWAGMPADALSVIFDKLGPIHVLCAAQAVCRSWRRLAHDPGTWRKVDFSEGVWDFYDQCVDMVKMGITAADRSQGMMEELVLEHFGDDEVIAHVSSRCPNLKRLKLVSCYSITDEVLEEALKRFPLLEEMDFTFQSFSTEEILPVIGESCPMLTSFHLNMRGCKYGKLMGTEDLEALKIAKAMPMLRELQLFGNQLTNEGLLAILDGCPRLESLDLRQCFNVSMDEVLKKRCAKITNLRLPNDSTSDYPFDSEVADLRREFLSDDDYYDNDDGYDFGMYEFDDFIEDYYGHDDGDFFVEQMDWPPEVVAFHDLFGVNFYGSD